MKLSALIFLLLNITVSSAFAADITNLTVGKSIVFTSEVRALDITGHRHKPHTLLASQYTELEQFGEFFAFNKSWIDIPVGTIAVVERAGLCRYEGGRNSQDNYASCAVLIKINDRYFSLQNKNNAYDSFEQAEDLARVFPNVLVQEVSR